MGGIAGQKRLVLSYGEAQENLLRVLAIVDSGNNALCLSASRANSLGAFRTTAIYNLIPDATR